jgi:hypothetical protein
VREEDVLFDAAVQAHNSAYNRHGGGLHFISMFTAPPSTSLSVFPFLHALASHSCSGSPSLLSVAVSSSPCCCVGCEATHRNNRLASSRTTRVCAADAPIIARTMPSPLPPRQGSPESRGGMSEISIEVSERRDCR